MRAFGQRLRERRVQLGMTQEALATRAGLHPTYVSRLERGKVNVSLAAILRLCHALEMSPANLFAEFDEVP